MSGRDRAGESLELGGVPRVHLLPPEIEGMRKVKAVRRGLVMVLAAAILVVILAVAAASLLLSSAMASQSIEQARGLQISTQMKKYSSVTGVQTQVDAITTSQPLAVSGEILWSPFIASVQATLPPGTVITSFVAKLNDVGAGGSTTPLVGDHIAIVSVTAQGQQEVLTGWLSQLTTIKGVVGATPGAFAIGTDASQYVVNVDLLVNSDVVADRFATGK